MTHQMPTKLAIEAARRNLEAIVSFGLEDTSGPSGAWRFHAHSANVSLRVLREAKQQLPAAVVANQRHLEVLGWRFA